MRVDGGKNPLACPNVGWEISACSNLRVLAVAVVEPFGTVLRVLEPEAPRLVGALELDGVGLPCLVNLRRHICQ
eukprot:73338-Pyramimonas_sp.AAC.1